MPFNPTQSTKLAAVLSALHKPGSPLLLTNIWDPPSTSLALSIPSTAAIATASFAISSIHGVPDEELSLEANVWSIQKIAATLQKSERGTEIPLTVDLQDGYGDRLEEAVKTVVLLGAVGCNLEDAVWSDGKSVLMEAEEAAARVRTVIETAREMGVEGFVVNARTDVVMLGGKVEEAVRRGKLYLEAGATTVFVWGGGRGLRDAEIEELVDGLEGRVNVIHRRSVEGALSVKQLAEMGVARISMGPGLWREGMAAVEKEMKRVLTDRYS